MRAGGLILLAAVAAGSWAGPRPDELDRLETDLTPVGALRAGNADGTIPAWEGGLSAPPVDHQPGAAHADPFTDDEPLFRIDAGNLAQYTHLLSEGQRAMLDAYGSTFYLPVYPTRRSAAFPQRIYQMTRRNGGSGRLAENGDGVTGVAEGFPFPFAENAQELIWNHKLKYKGHGSRRHFQLVAPTQNGNFQPVRLYIETLSLYHQPGATLESSEHKLLFLLQTIESPARLAGTLLLVHESLNQVLQPRLAWTFNPGQRRVIRAPNVAYDNPSVAADGLMFSDMADMFNGALDRFDWELAGQREMIVPYNGYRVGAPDLDLGDAVLPGHLDPALLRYERHRVWVVEARLRAGQRHVHPRRTYYLDEDSYQIVMTDHYDERGLLWRYSEAHPVVYYDVPTLWTALEIHHDLQSRRYVFYRLDSTSGVPRFDLELPRTEFLPQSLRRRAR